MNIVHFITRGIFTASYINFMKIHMKEHNHVFFTSSIAWREEDNLSDRLVNDVNVEYYSHGRWIAFSPTIRRYLKHADKIIVTGIFGIETSLLFWPRRAYKKMYLQFWGGDFYRLRDSIDRTISIEWLHRQIMFYCMKKSYGAVFIVEDDYKKYMEITGIHNECVFIAGVPENPLEIPDFSCYRENISGKTLRIVIGNSAIKENCHKEVLDYLYHLRDEKIEIFCPLSYGDEAYRKEIIEYGMKLFGSKFQAITKWMKQKDYYYFLSTCHIGIFNNNRQQAMGSINAMIRMGRKVYLRQNTSMSSYFNKKGFVVHDVMELDNCSILDLKVFQEKENNIQAADSCHDMEEFIDQWNQLLDS